MYMFAGGETALAQKCLLRARLLTLTIHGEDHPYVATLDVMLLHLCIPAQKRNDFFYTMVIDNIYLWTILLFFADLSWVGVGRRSVRTVLKERPQTNHLLLRPRKRARCSQVRCQLYSHFTRNCFTPFSNIVTIFLLSCLCSQHLLAQWMCSKGDYRSAMTHEKEALAVFTSMVSSLYRKWRDG